MNLLKLFDPLYRWLTWYMASTGLILFGGKGGGAPPPPDYTGAAREQAAASQELATQNTWANRPTQNTPWGSTSWSAGSTIDPATGQPVTTWTQNQTLDPRLQGALNDQLAIQSGKSGLAQGFMGRVADEYSRPFNWSGLPQVAGTPGTRETYGRNMQTYIPTTTRTTDQANFVNERQRIENQMFERMRPEHQRQEDSIRTMLANQGLTPGSEAYNQELQRLSDTQSRERFNALEMGGAEQARLQQMLMQQQQQAYGQQLGQGQFYNQAQQQMFGQDQAANQQNWQQSMAQAEYQNRLRQQAIAEQQMQRGMSLNEMNALLTGQQVQNPQMPGFNTATMGQAPQLLQAAGMQGNYNMQAQQMNQQADQALWGGIGQLAGTAAMFMSDARLKRNVIRVGTHPRGIGIYEYDIGNRRERGVMAQELLKVAPWLVAVNEAGFLMVNYGEL